MELGAHGTSVWNDWTQKMTHVQPDDKDYLEALGWFMVLYRSGREKRSIGFKPGGMPLSIDERRAVEAGRLDR